MRYRPHRGSLADAMREQVELAPTIAALREHIGDMGGMVRPETIAVETYDDRPDPRCGWPATFLVMGVWCTGQYAPIGMTDQMPHDGEGEGAHKG